MRLRLVEGRKAIFLHLAVERRAADAKPSRHRRHSAAMMDEGETDRRGLEFAQLAAYRRPRLEQRQRGGIGDFPGRRLAAVCAAAPAPARGAAGMRTSKPGTSAAIWGNSADGEFVRLREDDGAIQCVLQLADVAPASYRRKAASFAPAEMPRTRLPSSAAKRAQKRRASGTDVVLAAGAAAGSQSDAR